MSVEGVGYSGQALGHAMRLAPLVEQKGFDGGAFIQMVADAHAGIGLIKSGYEARTESQSVAVSPNATGVNLGNSGVTLA